jgi:hypothetical protein
MKMHGVCDTCKASVVVRSEYLNPNGERKCGLCLKGAITVGAPVPE